MQFPTKLFIDGNLCGASDGKRIPSSIPRPRKGFAKSRPPSVKDVDPPWPARSGRSSGWRDLAPGKRTEILFKIARKLREHLEEIAQLEMPHDRQADSDARDETGLGARIFEYYAGAISKFCGQTIPVARGGFDFTLRQPMGVVAAIVPWNFPFPIACWKVAPRWRRAIASCSSRHRSRRSPR